MPKGKIAAQVAHAAVTATLSIQQDKKWKDTLQKWLTTGMKKIVVSCDDEAELIQLFNQAKSLGLPAALITDSGFTCFNGVPTKTCCAVGPCNTSQLNFTSQLKLL